MVLHYNIMLLLYHCEIKVLVMIGRKPELTWKG